MRVDLHLLSEIARSMGLSTQVLYKLRQRHESFPKPETESGNVKLYDMDVVKAWYEANVSTHPNSRKNVKLRRTA